MSHLKPAALAALLFAASAVHADSTMVVINTIDATGIKSALGTIHVEDEKDGLALHLMLAGLPPGEHGFHVHENGDCAPAAKDGKSVVGLAAGGHYDPGKTGKHEGPKGKGHKGDLPAITADAKGAASDKLMAPNLKVADLKGRSLMIHEGGDNYADNPKPLGGGGNRIACGVVK